MRESKTNRGARVPLFERLVDREPLVSWEPQPFRVFGRTELEESVRSSVSRILNTRSCLPAHLQDYVRGTVLDFGIPDITNYTPTSEPDRIALADLLASRIATYEPRLRNIKIAIEQHPTNHRALIAVLRASLVVDSTERPVSFPLAIDSEGADTATEEGAEPLKSQGRAAGT